MTAKAAAGFTLRTHKGIERGGGLLPALGAALLLAGGMLGSTFVLAQNASRTEQKNVHGVQIALAAAHVAALFYIFERLKKAPKLQRRRLNCLNLSSARRILQPSL